MLGLVRALQTSRDTQVILRLYDQFVQPLTMQDAHDTFCNMVYAVEEGVQGFYDALLNHAQNIAMFPNKFTIFKEFVSEAKAYESSIKTAAHYLEHSKQSQLEWQLSLAAVQSPAIGTVLAKWTEVFVQAAHTAAPSDVGEANDEQEEEPAKADANNTFESDGTQEHGEEYIELEIYNNKYYTHSSESEGLFALTEAPIGKHREKEPSNKVCMQKVWLMVSKDAMEHPVLPA
ncbi:hypothetical protein C0989_003630 [Termitomyces sp. Mn162]|nr:hypothetical protein C0989_003630 [Termitomyces sp. Mn162]